MRLTLKTIITTISYIWTLATAGYLCFIYTSCYLYPYASSVQIPHDRFQQLGESYISLHHNVTYHATHVKGPITKALLDQTIAVYDQVSDLIVDLGCAKQKPVEDICWVLKAQELRLRVEILQSYVDAKEKEVERHIDAEKEEVETEPLFEQEHGGWNMA